MSIVRDIAQGLRFLHTANPPVVHKDLKSKNVLIDSQFRAKVSDFGLLESQGTPYFMAPEVLLGGRTTPASDMYSFGITLYEIFSRKHPYKGKAFKEVIRLVTDNTVKLRPPIPQSCPVLISDIMLSCYDADPELRISAVDVDEKVKKSVDSNQGTDPTTGQQLPDNVGKALQEGRKLAPQHHQCVTVFFSDIVSYADIAAELSPTKLSDMLDRLYTKFDRLCRVHSVYKMENIGDAYMTCTNLATEQHDHVSIMAHFALDVVKAARSTLIDESDPSKGNLEVRVGIHSGPVASNVIGSINPQYSIVGDTVIVAARMEATSRSGRIHCSQDSAKLLAEQEPELDLHPRGTIEIKGKRNMASYWVGGFDPESNGNDSCCDLDQMQTLDDDTSYVVGSSRALDPILRQSNENEQNITANTQVLSKYLRKLVASRRVSRWLSESSQYIPNFDNTTMGQSLYSEVSETIKMPAYNPKVADALSHSQDVKLSNQVASQLRNFVSVICNMYPENAFHNFAVSFYNAMYKIIVIIPCYL